MFCMSPRLFQTKTIIVIQNVMSNWRHLNAPCSNNYWMSPVYEAPRMLRWPGFFSQNLMRTVDQTLCNGGAATLSSSQQLHLLQEKFCRHRPHLWRVSAHFPLREAWLSTIELRLETQWFGHACGCACSTAFSNADDTCSTRSLLSAQCVVHEVDCTCVHEWQVRLNG